MMRCRIGASWVVLSALAGLSALPARASDRSVVQELLDILKRNDQISQEKYDELRERAAADEKGKLRVFWKEGFHLESAGGAFKLKLGARINNDWALVEADGLDDDFGRAAVPGGIPANRTESLDDIETGTEFRRARISLDGVLYGVVPFKMEYDFAGGDPEFKDVWVGFTGIPGIQAVKVGHMKEPFSLEELTSGRHVTFLERGLPNALVPSRNTGVGVYLAAFEQRVTWAAGAFRDTGDFGDGFGSDSKYNITSRLTGTPWYEEDGRRLLHLGFSYSHQFRNDDSLRYRRKPEADLFPVNLVDTRLAVLATSGPTNVDLQTDGVNLLNPELALVVGPFSLQSESVHSLADVSGGRDPEFYGVYVLVSYFLTGEHRPYKLADAAFDRVHPQHDLLWGDGWGAWEVAARFSRLDLDDGAARGGELNDVTAALNWYLNPNVKIMLNYVYADREGLGGTSVVQGRFHIDF